MTAPDADLIHEADELRRRLYDSEESFRLLMEAVRDFAIFRLDPEGRIVSWDAGAERVHGYREEEVLGRSFELFYPEEDRKRQVPQEELRKAAETGHADDTRWLVHKSGALIWVQGVTTARRDAAGALTGFSKVTRDATPRKRLEDQLRQSQKMEAIGRLAGGVAHDFNNLLTIITGHAQMLVDSLSPEDALRLSAQEILGAANRGAALAQQLLALGRRQPAEIRTLDLNALVASMGGMLRRTIGEDIALTLDVDPRADRVRGDPAQIEQVIMNLVVNARDAMPRGGRLTIRTLRAGPMTPRPPELAPGEYVVLEVSDTGHGMDAETLSHVFDPFFSTKPPGIGSGLGLTTVHAIVRQNQGDVLVESAAGQGTVARVYLPYAEEARRPRGAVPVEEAKATILLVEDEAGVRKMAREMLRRRGYDVLEAANGEEALRLEEQHRGPIHLLLTDVVMPLMNGPELAGRICALRPQTRVVYMSGYSAEVLQQQGPSGSAAGFLAKPFTSDKLAAAIRAALEAPES